MLSKGFDKTAVDWAAPPADPNAASAAAMQAGGTARGTTMSQGWKNLKAGLGMGTQVASAGK